MTFINIIFLIGINLTYCIKLCDPCALNLIYELVNLKTSNKHNMCSKILYSVSYPTKRKPTHYYDLDNLRTLFIYTYIYI